MSGAPFSDEKIVDSWNTNATAWGEAIRAGQIESRTLITNQAIIDTVLRHEGTSVLDLGCGEGWLAREMTARGKHVLGVDAVPALIEQARGAGGRFEVMSYEDLAAGKLHERFDLIVANFSLLGEDSVARLFAAMRALLKPRGVFVVQTIHPLQACGESPYVDGWRAGSWAGFGSDFSDPAPWYFRTLASWVELFVAHGLELVELNEPLHPNRGKPASAIFVGKRSDG
ncbi:class I SAM-dependent methyltransferase [Pseudolysobacter antarcticus]|uniref:Class I SAM-dependent methyltransferase n=1 Tax=Pseudolysobacter antarcticus TaxID=2511995 RepID=A0A411HGE4_9GAMM|nr:class I SAM-dependent methyltransferase [Pseudolysobacter antarcticus]QBB69531.1 class I SAM-dependent methyltransferase [Pseudolysobacter antarcticus]